MIETTIKDRLEQTQTIFSQKKEFNDSEFDKALKNAEFAVVGMDTDSFDLRQSMEPLLNNSNLTIHQHNHVVNLRKKLYKILTQFGLVDTWEVAIPE